MIIPNSKKYAAELVGTFILVFTGCGSAIFAGADIGFTGIALTFGLTLMFLVYAIGPISGCHVNPAVTLAFATTGKLPAKEIVPYIIAQMVGGILAAAVLYYIATGKVGFDITKGFATNGYGEHSPHQYSMMAAGITEMAMTALLLFVVLSTTHPRFSSGFAGIAIGTTLLVIHLVSIPITNTSVNFARSFGVALLQGGWALHQLWLFAVAQIIAVVVATILYHIVFPKK